jgi:predicted TIM-barrel fold metal-dependent hydrolase
MLGIDHLMFSVDYPFQDNFAAMQFLDRCDLSAADKERFAVRPQHRRATPQAR